MIFYKIESQRQVDVLLCILANYFLIISLSCFSGAGLLCLAASVTENFGMTWQDFNAFFDRLKLEELPHNP